MNFSIFAGLFCTLSFIALCFETYHKQKRMPLPISFTLLYSLGLIFWIVLALYMKNNSLAVISMIQLIGLLFSQYLIMQLKKESNL